MRMVIAIGGNALLPKGAKGTAEEQEEAAHEALRRLSSLFDDHQVALTHGNGPQVGSLLLQQQSTKKVPEMPLDVLDAMTQGEIGYFVQSAFSRKSAVVLTRVIVNPHDNAFRNPTKPIGPFYKARPKGKERYVMDAGRGYRIVVPSPKPIAIMEREAILSLLDSGFVVICGGGGGIPVTKGGKGVEAVIDKDDFSSLLASSIKADTLIFITSVDAAYTDFGRKSQKRVAHPTTLEMDGLLDHFAEGSMKPKVKAALRFLKKGGRRAIICSIGNIEKAMSGNAGTLIKAR